VVILKKGWSFDRCVNVISKTGHTRYPVCVDSLDDTLGLLHIKDLQRAPTKPGSIVDLVRPLPTIPATMKISRLLRQMQRTRKHMVLAVDERGTALGIVTMENVLEEIVGAVQDEFDTEERREISPEGRDQFIVQGDVTIDRINRDLKLDLYAPDADTLSGLLVGKVGRMLHAGDEITLDGAVAEVLEVRGDRASRVRLRLTREVDLVQRESTSEADDREQDEP
jgi:CBS domain containing-hemolysin-like protein